MYEFVIRHRKIFTSVCNLVLIAVSLSLSFLLRFDFRPAAINADLLLSGLAIALIIKGGTFAVLGMSHGWWRHVGVGDAIRVTWANLVATALFVGTCLILLGPSFPRTVYALDFLLCLMLTVAARFGVRIYTDVVQTMSVARNGRGALIYGGGAAGIALLREIRENEKLDYRVLGFIDDDRSKRGSTILGVPVLGAGREVPRLVNKLDGRGATVEEIILAMPSVAGLERREALANCRAAGVRCRIIPSMGDLLEGRFLTDQIREVNLTDLLGREPVRLEEQRIRSAIAGHSVLVTGAGGSIGSELCRQIGAFEPARLVILDQAESDLFHIDHELRAQFPSLEIVPVIADIRDSERVREVLGSVPLDAIFHAAAYKHVPLMERHPVEAVRTNVLGTWNLATEAMRHHVPSFLMISSDKAVNPVNIMGLTKRVAELVVNSLGQISETTKFNSVRFGNVLGSNGSVVPIFRRQIASGGPVTVTHPEVRRFFMTTREAVQLVLQASIMGKRAEIFVLEMGELIRIADLAQNMIRLSGLEPEKDIEIRYTGLRPGEKLYEEVITEGEDVLPTYHEKIKIFRTPEEHSGEVEAWVATLQQLVDRRNGPALVAHMSALVPEYRPSTLWQEAVQQDDHASAAQMS